MSICFEMHFSISNKTAETLISTITENFKKTVYVSNELPGTFQDTGGP